MTAPGRPAWALSDEPFCFGAPGFGVQSDETLRPGASGAGAQSDEPLRPGTPGAGSERFTGRMFYFT